jgi:hypothetical protein
VRDAFPTAKGNVDLEGVIGAVRTRDGRGVVTPNFAVEIGAAEGVEVRIGGLYDLGGGAGTRPGSLGGGVRVRLLDEEGGWPALAVLAEATPSFGPGARGAATELTLIASRTTGRGPGNWGLHLNAGWLSAIAPGPLERRHGYRFGVALSHVATEHTVLIAAFQQQTQARGERDLSVFEAGLDQRLGESLSWGIAAGVGLSPASPSLRVRAVVTLSF